jgi:hypothetical protein
MWTFQDIIRRIKRHPGYKILKDLREFWFLVIFLLTFVKYPFSKPTLELKYNLDTLYSPIVSNNLIKTESIKLDENNPLTRLINSRDLLRITIQNNSSKTIQNVDLQIEALSIADIAIHSNSSNIMSDRATLASYEISDNFIARFPNFTTIPPRAEIEMLIWGDFNIYSFSNIVKIFSSADTIHIVREGSLSGIKLFVGSNLSILTIFFSIALLLLGLRRYSKDR